MKGFHVYSLLSNNEGKEVRVCVCVCVREREREREREKGREGNMEQCNEMLTPGE